MSDAVKRAARVAWRRWVAVAHVIGAFQAKVFLSLFYFVVITPFALGVRLFADPLRLKRRGAPGWLPRERAIPDTFEAVRRQG